MRTRSERPKVVPLSFDLGGIVRRSVASLYSHLITRPTGQALRLGIESQIGEMGEVGEFCLSILDFSGVTIIDYSCADETVAKLILRYQSEDRPTDAFFIIRGLDQHHHETIETVLERYQLVVTAEEPDGRLTLIGEITPLEKRVWSRVGEIGRGEAKTIAGDLKTTVAEVDQALERLAHQRVLVRRPETERYYALRYLINGEG